MSGARAVGGLLDRKVVIVTGAGSGIGGDIALVFAREGAQLVLTGRTLDSLEKSRDKVVRAGGKAIALGMDVTHAESCAEIVRRTCETFGRLDCAVNNAGCEGEWASTVDYKETVFDQVMATNAKGVWNCMRFEIPAMIRAGGGSIVNISSVATEPATPLISAYVASKYAVVGLSKTAALEYAALNVRVNIISPGLIDTPMVRKLMAAHPNEMEAMRLDNPIPRLGTGAEIGEAAAWLCSDRSAYCTGTNLFIDGGRALK